MKFKLLYIYYILYIIAFSYMIASLIKKDIYNGLILVIPAGFQLLFCLHFYRKELSS